MHFKVKMILGSALHLSSFKIRFFFSFSFRDIMPRLTKFRCDRNLKEWSRFRHAKYIHGGLGNVLVKKGNKKLRRPLIALEDLNHSGFNLFDPISTTINQAAPLKVSEIELFPLVQTNCLLSRNFTRNYPNYAQSQ